MVEAPSWLSRNQPDGLALSTRYNCQRCRRAFALLFMASDQTCRATARTHSFNDIDAGSAEPQITHYRDSPTGLPQGRNRLGDQSTTDLKIAMHETVPVMFLYTRFQRSAMTIRSSHPTSFGSASPEPLAASRSRSYSNYGLSCLPDIAPKR